MDTDKIARGQGPENTPYDKIRHEKMRLRDNGSYGRIKIFSSSPTGRCKVCQQDIFGQHLEGNTVHNWCYGGADASS